MMSLITIYGFNWYSWKSRLLKLNKQEMFMNRRSQKCLKLFKNESGVDTCIFGFSMLLLKRRMLSMN